MIFIFLNYLIPSPLQEKILEPYLIRFIGVLHKLLFSSSRQFNALCPLVKKL